MRSEEAVKEIQQLASTPSNNGADDEAAQSEETYSVTQLVQNQLVQLSQSR